MSKLLSIYGLKFNPFRPDVPAEALFTPPAVDSFLRRIELGIADGGFAMLTGDPGTGKSIVLRLLAERLRALPDVLVGTVEHPQSRRRPAKPVVTFTGRSTSVDGGAGRVLAGPAAVSLFTRPLAPPRAPRPPRTRRKQSTTRGARWLVARGSIVRPLRASTSERVRASFASASEARGGARIRGIAAGTTHEVCTTR